MHSSTILNDHCYRAVCIHVPLPLKTPVPSVMMPSVTFNSRHTRNKHYTNEWTGGGETDVQSLL